MTDANEPRTVRFGVFEADLRTGELRKNGVLIKLQEQPFQVLVTLLKHAWEVVTHEELRHELWPTDTFVDFDHSLNAAVKRLRDALGESAENPIFVETLARRGYRFNAPVDRGPASPKAQPPSLPAPITRALQWPHLLALAGIAVALLALIAALTWAWNNRGRIGTGKAIESVAVLPLENLSHDPEQEYFSDGMTDALTAQLTKTGGLRVISRTSGVNTQDGLRSVRVKREVGLLGHLEMQMESAVLPGET